MREGEKEYWEVVVRIEWFSLVFLIIYLFGIYKGVLFYLFRIFIFTFRCFSRYLSREEVRVWVRRGLWFRIVGSWKGKEKRYFFWLKKVRVGDR